MGVTLERVQNKFACIIGELSNEPDIMSQFAIWVDLRIAEYKAKGAISLDCSGASPNPVWLRGFRPMKYESTERNFPQGSPAPVPTFEKNPVNFLKSSLEDNDNSLWENAGVSLNSPLRSESPDLVMWDDERSQPSSETAIAHQRYSANPVQRPASETFTGRNHYPRARSLSDETFMPSPPKISKFERNSEHLTNETKVYAMPGSRQTKPVVQPEVSIVLDNAEHNTTTPFNLAQATPPKKTVQPAHPSPLKLVSSSSESTAAINSPSSTTTGTSIFPADACEEAEYKFPTLINHPRLRHVKSRFPNLRGRSPNVMNRIAGSVAIFDCWLRDTQHEMRNMEEIPPKQLDDYLVKFLPVVKKVNGDDFDPESFKNIWVRLELFLNENSYSESIRKSRLFSRSQDAFAKKFRYLALKSAEKLQIKYQPP